MYKKFPDTIATFVFVPAGLSWGFLFFLPLINESEYDSVSFWPFFTMLFSIVVSASVITIIKLNNGKYIFEHFTYLLAASLLYIVAGILLVTLRTDQTKASIFIVAIANGIVYVAGLSYVNIRAEKQERPMRIALCHAWKIIGFVLVKSVLQYVMDNTDRTPQRNLEIFHQILGYEIIGTSGIFIILLAINEFRQRQDVIYNYKDCLDHDNSIANNYCKLFSKNEVIVERNPTVSAAGLWKSTENLLPRTKQNYTSLWTIYCLLPKLHGAVIFHFFLIALTEHTNDVYISWQYSRGLGLLMMALGSIIGCFLLRYVSIDKVYTLSSILGVTILAIVFSFYWMSYDSIAIALLFFFFMVTVAVSVPDIALMEIAKIRFSEGALAGGYFLEIIPIAILQNKQRELNPTLWYESDTFLPLIITSIVILIVTSLVYQLHMPPTFNKSLLQIQNELLKFKKYFALNFDETVKTVPRRSSETNHYSASNSIVNVFENHEQNIATATPNDYTEVIEKLPDPIDQTYDYSKEITKPPAIIPRVKISKSDFYKN